MDKLEQLLELARKRQQTVYAGYTSIGDYNDGAYECNFVSPYSISAHNENAQVLVMLQDWCSSDSFGEDVCQETLKYGYTPSVRTNIKLKELLLEHFRLELKDTYSTNLFPFIKPGVMNTRIPTKDMYRAALDFAIPLIDIIKPSIVICLGKQTFNALRKACELKVVNNIQEGIESHFTYKTTEIFCQAHTGMLGQNNRNRNGIHRVTSDWCSMREYYDGLSQSLK